jgi:type IV secretion system protein VirB6
MGSGTASIGFFQYFLHSADNAVHNFVFRVWDQFQADYSQPLTAILIVSVAILGYAVWTGFVEMTVREVTARMLKLVIPFVLITNHGAFERFVYRVATDLPAQIGTTMVQSLGKTGQTIDGSLDAVAVTGFSAASKIWQEAGIADIGTILVGYLIYGVTLLGMIPIALVMLLSKLAVGVLLALAPFAIALYFFNATRSLFEGWLRQLLTFALVPTLLYALLGLVVSMLADVANPVAAATEKGLPSFTEITPYALVLLVVAVLCTQVVTWSSGIAGALALSASNAFQVPSALAAGTRIAQAAGRGAAIRPDALPREGRAAALRTGVAQAALTARYAASSGLRHAMGLRQHRPSDPYWRSRPPTAPKPPDPATRVPESSGDGARS